ncbi:transporter substrate-binding domain-containing protein [Falsiroseomonas sp. CW058]|uniref:transporter substrate-binding domain-containing protein n=1 Tax=Falsiroseomonas sp. CW058 TaxID=3388664 RepID=UPI003D31EDD5
MSIAAEVAPTGRLRATINLGNPVLALRTPDGRIGGVSAALAHALGRRLGLPVDLHPFDTAGGAFAALASGACDIGFLARDPKRAEEVMFTTPYVVIEGTCLVRADSPIVDVAAIDAPGLRIAAGRNSAYDLHLSRSLKHARLVHGTTGEDALALFLDQGLDMLAGVRQPLEAHAAAHPGFRVLPGGFMRIEQAMAVPRGRAIAHAFVEAFLGEAKLSGAVRFGLDASGNWDAAVAP